MDGRFVGNALDALTDGRGDAAVGGLLTDVGDDAPPDSDAATDAGVAVLDVGRGVDADDEATVYNAPYPPVGPEKEERLLV